MFLTRLAAGLVFTSGAGLSRFAVLDDSMVLMVVGFATAAGGFLWFTRGPTWAEARREREPRTA